MSSNLKRKLRACFKNSCNIKIILKSPNRLSSLFRFKGVIPKELQFHIVYKFSCGNGNVTYYGKNESHLNVRSSEQIGISHLTGKWLECMIVILTTLLSHLEIIMVSDILKSRDSSVLNKNTVSIPLLLFD